MPPKRLRGKATSSGNVPARQVTQPTNQTAEEIENAAALALHQELAWCMERLEAQMKSKNTNQKQMEEASRAWKNLQSARTPLVKKRQIMRSMFGDYRATMEKEARQYAIRPQNMSITPVRTEKAPKSKYFKSSSFCPANVMESTTKNFQFDFSLSDNSQSAMTNSAESTSNQQCNAPSAATSTTTANTQRAVAADNSQSDTVAAVTIAENYYVMSNTRTNSDTAGFTFDFNVE